MEHRTKYEQVCTAVATILGVIRVFRPVRCRPGRAHAKCSRFTWTYIWLSRKFRQLELLVGASDPQVHYLRLCTLSITSVQNTRSRNCYIETGLVLRRCILTERSSELDILYIFQSFIILCLRESARWPGNWILLGLCSPQGCDFEYQQCMRYEGNEVSSCGVNTHALTNTFATFTRKLFIHHKWHTWSAMCTRENSRQGIGN